MAVTIQNIGGALFMVFIVCAVVYNGIYQSRAAKAATEQAQLIVAHGLWLVSASFDDMGGTTLKLYDGGADEPVHTLSFSALHPVSATLFEWVKKQDKVLHTVEFTLAPRQPDEFAGYMGDITAHLLVVGKGVAPYRSVPQLA